MGKYIKHIILFLLPLMLYGIAVRVVDPFNYFDASKLNKGEQMQYAYPINRTLYRLIEFNRTKKHKVLIGDSRMNYIGALTDTIDSEFFNFSSGGATMYQMLDVFEYITDVHQIDEVVFQVSFDDFNEKADYSELPNALSITNNYWLYLYSINNLKAMYHLAIDGLLGTNTKIGGIEESKEEYWQQCIKQEYEFNRGQGYVYGNALIKRMKDMVLTCKRENIKLTFVLLPVHNDILSIIKTENEQNYMRFKQDMRQIVGSYTFIDLSELPIILNREAFKDPYHLEDNATRMKIFKSLTGY